MSADQRGVVLVVVSWLVVLSRVMAVTVSNTSRADTRLVGASVAAAKARAAAESGLWLAVHGLLFGDDELWPTDGTWLTTTFNGSAVAVSIQDQAGLLDLNVSAKAILQRVIGQRLGDDRRGVVLSDKILDWRDGDTSQPLVDAWVVAAAAAYDELRNPVVRTTRPVQ